MGPLMGGTIVCAIISVIVAVVAVIADNVNMGAFGDFMVNYSYYFHVLTALFMISLLCFVDFRRISPGAMII